MLQVNRGFSSFSVDDMEAAQNFYGETLGLEVEMTEMGLGVRAGGAEVFIYPKPNHEPASFTVLNLIVPDLGAAVDTLVEAGITMERYDDMPDIVQDERGIARGEPGRGPDIAWFNDPAGNTIAVIQG
jgi:catechol 2,3-dioxygenase-like lactoylglutathione lyase family enzyme